MMEKGLGARANERGRDSGRVEEGGKRERKGEEGKPVKRSCDEANREKK